MSQFMLVDAHVQLRNFTDEPSADEYENNTHTHIQYITYLCVCVCVWSRAYLEEGPKKEDIKVHYEMCIMGYEISPPPTFNQSLNDSSRSSDWL